MLVSLLKVRNKGNLFVIVYLDVSLCRSVCKVLCRPTCRCSWTQTVYKLTWSRIQLTLDHSFS